MKVVSNGYKETMNQVVRPTSLFQARLEMIDRGVETDSTIIEQQKAPFATSVFDTKHECDYITFEKDFFAVGGNALILPESNYLANGFVSSVMTDEEGNFSPIPTIDISFGQIREFVGMTYTFVKDYPKQIRVTAFLDGERVSQFISEPDGLEFVDAVHHIQNCDRVRFEFLSMNEPYRRLRINRLLFGFVKVFETKDVISTKHTMSIDPVSSSLPSNKLSMHIANYDKGYNPDNPQGMWEYFKNGQPLRVRYGTTVNDNVEWVDAAYLFLSDAPTVDGSVASFEANDLLSYMTNTYYKGIWREKGISLYDLAVDIFEDAGVTAYEIPQSLKSVITYAPMPNLTHRECLQLIANAGRCVLYCDISGKVVMKLQFDADATVTDNGHAPWSNVQQAYDHTAAYDYITFEPNKWRVENKDNRLIMSDGNYKPTGFVSSAISDNNGQFASHPTLYVAYSLPVSSYQFKIGFDSINEDYAPDFNVIFSDNGEVVKNIRVRGNTEVVYTIDEEVIDYTLVTIEILSASRPYHRIRVESINSGQVTDFYLDFSVAMAKPTVIRTEELKSVDVVTHLYTAQGTLEEIYRTEDVLIEGEKEIQVTYLPSFNIEAQVTGGTLVSARLYAETAFLTIRSEGSVDILLTGVSLTEKEMTVSVSVNKTGEICPLDNPLITDRATAQAVGEWVAKYYKNRSSYEVNFRQDFRLDPNDVIYIQSEFEEMIPARITKLQYSLPGQEGAISVRRLT